MSLIDLFKWFHSQAVTKNYPSSVRTLYDTLLYEFNARLWCEEISYSERELSGLTGLGNASVHRAIKFLADRGYIKTWCKGNRTIFKLLGISTQKQRSNVEAPVEQKPLLSIPSTNLNKMQDIKTTPPNPPRGASGETKGGIFEKDLSIVWIEEMPGNRPLGSTEKYELASLEEKYGYELIRKVIVKTKQSRYYPTFVDFKKLLEEEVKEVKEVEREYKKPRIDKDLEEELKNIKL